MAGRPSPDQQLAGLGVAGCDHEHHEHHEAPRDWTWSRSIPAVLCAGAGAVGCAVVRRAVVGVGPPSGPVIGVSPTPRSRARHWWKDSGGGRGTGEIWIESFRQSQRARDQRWRLADPARRRGGARAVVGSGRVSLEGQRPFSLRVWADEREKAELMGDCTPVPSLTSRLPRPERGALFLQLLPLCPFCSLYFQRVNCPLNCSAE